MYTYRIETGDPNTIYWSVENNGLGEAALIVINDFGEENIPGLFVSEPIRKGHVRKFQRIPTLHIAQKLQHVVD